MALKETIKELRNLLSQIQEDLEKAEKGTKAAAQRVRTGTIKLSKVAKIYRKESISSEKRGGTKKTVKAAKPTKVAKSTKKVSAPQKKKKK